MRSWIVGSVVGVLGLAVCGCSRNRETGSLVAPSPAAAPAALEIKIAEINGPNSFYPSPATVQADGTIVWRNVDTVTHHLVLDDGTVDTGTLAPGTTSQPETVAPGNRTYHCTIHPSMVGTVVGAAVSVNEKPRGAE